MNYIFYHMFYYGDCIERFNKTLQRIKSSGLYNNTNLIFLNVVGTNNLTEQITSLQANDFKICISNISTETHGEMDTLRLLWDTAQNFNDTDNILYLHSKGVSKPDSKNVDAWKDYMEYFLIDKWETSLETLSKHTCCGVNLQVEPMKHFSGNFWWARGSYIKTTKRFSVQNSSYVLDSRSYCEFWLLDHSNCNPFSLHNSNINHYSDFYSEDMYKTPNNKAYDY